MQPLVSRVLLCALPLVAGSAVSRLALAAEPVEGPSEAGGQTVAHEGEASEGRLPVAEAERPLTLPAMVLSPEIDFDVLRADGGTYSNLTFVGAMGLTDDLTLRAVILPLQLTSPGPSSFRYGQPTEVPGPSVGATYRLHRGGVEIGASLDLGLSTVPNVSGLLITPGVPVRFHVGKKMRVDTGAYLPISRLTPTSTSPGAASGQVIQDNFTSTVGLNVPVSVLYDLTEPLHVGASTAFSVGDVSEWSNTSSIPLSLFTGYAVAGKDGPILDLDPFFTFPALFTPGQTPATHTADYVIGIAVGGFLYL